jgi:ABC-type sugar transport system substrate-binding protein
MKARIWPMLLVTLTLVGCGAPAPEIIEEIIIITATFPPTPLPPTPTDTACAPNCTYEDMKVGFLQTGAESSWRVSNTVSFKETSEQLGIDMRFHDAQHDFEKQIAAFREFIADDEMDVIILAPLEPTGYDEVLQEARDAGKIVIVEGQPIDAPEDLYATYVGSDFIEEGRRAGEVMIDLLADSQSKNVVELAGPIDSPVAVDRGVGFREAIEGSGIVITQSQNANWSATQGKQVMEDFLAQSRDIQGVLAQNDEMALGAIEAIREAGLEPGVDIKIISINATAMAFKAMLDGELNVTVECNPLLAPQVYEAALKALNGEELPKWIPTWEGIFYPEDVQDFWTHHNY